MVGLMLLIFDLSCCFSGAYGTSTFLLSGSGVDGRFPNMPFSAFPPYPLVTSRRYHFWGQTAIQRAIPLRGDFRMKRSKIIKTGQNAPSCAVWAAGVLYSSCCNDGLPFMTKCASPPYLSVAEGSNLIFPSVSELEKVQLSPRGCKTPSRGSYRLWCRYRGRDRTRCSAPHLPRSGSAFRSFRRSRC